MGRRAITSSGATPNCAIFSSASSIGRSPSSLARAVSAKLPCCEQGLSIACEKPASFRSSSGWATRNGILSRASKSCALCARPWREARRRFRGRTPTAPASKARCPPARMPSWREARHRFRRRTPPAPASTARCPSALLPQKTPSRSFGCSFTIRRWAYAATPRERKLKNRRFHNPS